jgi:hypothetical protein
MITRRRFVKTAGALGAALPFASLLSPEAQSQSENPQRLLIVHMPNVVWRSEWVPRGGRDVTQGSGDHTQFEFGPQSAFFQPIRDQVTIIDGVPIARPGGDPHVASQIHFMSGDVKITTAEGAEESHAPSIDQVLSKDSPVLSKGQITPAINLSAHTIGESIRPNIHLLSFDHNLQPVFPQNSPLELYKNLFAGFAPGANDADQAELVQRTLAQDKSVLDFVDGSLQRLMARAPAYERTKLETHLQGLRELENKLSVRAMGGNLQKPDQGQYEGLELNNTTDHERVIDAFFSLIRTSFAFDLTRMATFMFASGHNWVELDHYVPGLKERGKVHEITHRSYAGKEQDMNLMAHWYGNQLVSFVQDLTQAVDSDGSPMIDNTLIVFFSEVTITGDGIAAQHAADNTPLAVIGGKNIGHSGGRCLRYQGRTTNDFWATVQQRFGVERQQFGKASDNHGGLPELFVG